MHEYDPNGDLREYHRERDRRNVRRGVASGFVATCVLLAFAWAVIETISWLRG